jgi:hypothetical protein
MAAVHRYNVNNMGQDKHYEVLRRFDPVGMMQYDILNPEVIYHEEKEAIRRPGA